jgi:hypothetical protein
MNAQRFQQPVTRVVVAGCLTAIIACFASGQVHAQFVNPVPPTNPTLNPSSPNIVTQPPVTPVSPSIPSGPGSVVSPSSNSNPPVVVEDHRSNSSETRTSSRSETRVRHYKVARHWSREPHYVVRITGPSYYPGFGLVYPPYPNPCHWVHAWNGAWDYPAYSCS